MFVEFTARNGQKHYINVNHVVRVTHTPPVPNASISAIVLYPNELKVYRNGKRPLYETIVENGFILTSTKDIARRAGVQGIAKKVEYKGTDLQP